MQPNLIDLFREAQSYIFNLSMEVNLEKISFFYDKQLLTEFNGPNMIAASFGYVYGIIHSAVILKNDSKGS